MNQFTLHTLGPKRYTPDVKGLLHNIVLSLPIYIAPSCPRLPLVLPDLVAMLYCVHALYKPCMRDFANVEGNG